MGRPLIRIVDDVALDAIAAIRFAIVARELVETGYGSLNVGGWRSDEHFFDWEEPAVRVLRDAIVDAVGIVGCPIRGWAVINRSGSYHRRHRHIYKRAGDLSAIYYVDAGGIPSANTFFELDPLEPELMVTPKPGRLAIFPSSTWHRVESHLGGGLRITVGIDLR